MRVSVQQEKKLLVTTEHALWRYDKAFIFTNQSEVDFWIAYVYVILMIAHNGNEPPKDCCS